LVYQLEQLVFKPLSRDRERIKHWNDPMLIRRIGHMLDQYDLSEIKRFRAELEEKEKGTAREHKEAREAFKAALNDDLEHFEDMAQCLVDGSFGYGAQAAFNMMSARSNRRGWIFNTLATLEWNATNRDARKVWHELDTDLQAAINTILDEVIKQHEEAE
jgi:hypothetical protein